MFNFDLYSFLLGGHVVIGILALSLMLIGIIKNEGNVKIALVVPYCILLAILWELMVPMTLIYYSRKNRKKSLTYKTDEELIFYYKEKIQAANDRLEFKLNAFDQLEESVLEKYGSVLPKEKLISALEKWYAEEIANLSEKIRKLEVQIQQ